MPLYEFYCEPCHTLFIFRSQKVDTSTVPSCPQCGAKLSRQVSPFAHIVAGKSSVDGFDADEIDDAKQEELIAKMTNRMDELGGDDADPAAAVQVMREMAKLQGKKFNADVEEAFIRIEAGEDPEKLEQEFSSLFDETHNPFADDATATPLKPSELFKRLQPPRRDPTWHDMQ